MMREDKPSLLRCVAAFSRQNPVAVGVMLFATVGGAAVALVLPFDDLSAGRRIIGGVIAGFYFGMFPLGVRLFG